MKKTLRKKSDDGNRKKAESNVIPTKCASKTNQSVVKRCLYKNFSFRHVKYFQNQHFEAVSGTLGRKILVVGNVLSSHKQEIHLSTSHYENCIDFGFQLDWNCYVDLKRTYLDYKLKFVKSCGYET